MGTYRPKKPVEATQWDGDEKRLIPPMFFWEPMYHEEQPGFFIKDTDGNKVKVEKDCWIVKLDEDQFACMSDKVFRATYEEVKSSTTSKKA